MQSISARVKQRKDSIEQFAKGGRTDLVEKEEAELKVVQEFLPAQMSDEEVEALIKKAIAETGAVSIKDMGKVMKILMPELTGRADGKTPGKNGVIYNQPGKTNILLLWLRRRRQCHNLSHENCR